jgi:hypothetical protein
VNNSSLQFLLKQNPAAVDIVSQTFKLTQEESKRLTQFPVGEGLFFAGLSHVVMRIIASPTEEQLITTNPQALLERQIEQEKMNAGAENASIPKAQTTFEGADTTV